MRFAADQRQRRFEAPIPGEGKAVSLAATHPAYRSGRTMFPSRVFDPDEVGRVLKSAHNSAKIGKTVAKGRLRGAPIFTLTLEERATCPRSCQMWSGCYGNNMQAAERIVGGPALEDALTGEVAWLTDRHPDGFLVRLHVLGDFYSVDYVRLWADLLAAFAPLHIFGFTAHRPTDDGIGAAIAALAARDWARFAVRHSGWYFPRRASYVMAPDDVPNHGVGAVTCPAQLGLTDCCATCALCWQTDRSIAFRRH
jgi:hypothetical protein